MTTKTRNEYIALVVILLVMGFVLYKYVFSGGSSSKVPVNPLASTALGPSAGSAASASEFLPNGVALDNSVLQNPVFSSLVPLPQFTVDASEVGIQNPFASATANTITPSTASSTPSTPTVIAGQETATPATTK